MKNLFTHLSNIASELDSFQLISYELRIKVSTLMRDELSQRTYIAHEIYLEIYWKQ